MSWLWDVIGDWIADKVKVGDYYFSPPWVTAKVGEKWYNLHLRSGYVMDDERRVIVGWCDTLEIQRVILEQHPEWACEDLVDALIFQSVMEGSYTIDDYAFEFKILGTTVRVNVDSWSPIYGIAYGLPDPRRLQRLLLAVLDGEFNR